MQITGFDHIVLCVSDVSAALAFYERTLGMTPFEDRADKWSLHFGTGRISLQSADSLPDMARNTTAGSANFCVVTEKEIDDVAAHLRDCGVQIVEGPGRKTGALGPMQSVYFNDPDGNLVEVCSYR